MSTRQLGETQIEISAENIGGIDSTTVSLQPGVNILEGRNATNRTSLLQAVMAALGSDRSTLKGDADEGWVELAFEDEQYTRQLVRRNDHVVFDGDPYLDDSTLADLFAFLIESNEARLAVERGEDLRELIMRPIDTDEIRAQIERLDAEKREVDEQLAELERLEAKLPELEERRTDVRDTIDEREAELEALEATLAELDADVSESRDRQEEIEAAFDRLRSARKELEDIEFDLETERETRAELEAEREELRAELEELTDVELDSPDEIAGRIEELRERKRALDATVSELQSVIRFNEERLGEGGVGLHAAEDDSETDGGQASVTDRLVEDGDTIACWTCGSEVERERVEETLERLRSLHREKLDERNDLTDRIDELSSRRKEIREHERRRDRLQERLEEIDEELSAQTDRIEELEAAREAQEARIDELEADTESFESTGSEYDEVIETHRRVSQLELELDRHREELAEVEDRIGEIEAQVAEREDLEERREEIADELTDLRTRVERIEADAVEAFNEHMSSILSMLEYANIDRIWIERREREVREGRRTVSRSAFDLHVVRTADDGTTYEDTVEHLSESEREVTGLVFALAGYLVHDVHEEVPFMLLDSLESIDSNRIADLVDYFEDYVDSLVVALLPEDAEALPDEYTYLTEI